MPKYFPSPSCPSACDWTPPLRTTSAPRCGRSAASSSRSARGARCTCCPPTTCRCGPRAVRDPGGERLPAERADDAGAEPRRHRRDRLGARGRRADRRRAERSGDCRNRAMRRRSRHAGLPGNVATVAAGAARGRPRRGALLRAEPRSQRHLHPSAPLDARVRTGSGRDGAGRGGARVPARLWPGDIHAVRPLAGCATQVGRRAVRLARARAGRGWTACRPGSSRTTTGRRRPRPRGGAGSGCCRTSTPTPLAPIRDHSSSPDGRPSGH